MTGARDGVSVETGSRPLGPGPVRGAGLSLGEFFVDVRETVARPSRRFAVVLERGALWGSLLLVLAPAYFAFHFAGEIYFRRDPFPGYSLLAPLVAATALVLLKFYMYHLAARLVARRRPSRGSFRDLLTLAGYTGIPGTAAVVLAFGVLILIPGPAGALLRSFRIASLSVLIALGVALFIWGLILLVLAFRLVYRLGDAKIVLAIVIGTAAGAASGLGVLLVIRPVKVEFRYLDPILSRRFSSFVAPEPMVEASAATPVKIHVDGIAYRFHAPERFDLVAYRPVGSSGNPRFGRIVGLPGETVELRGGQLVIDGRPWREPYIALQFSAAATVEPQRLGRDAYFVLPEDRRLVAAPDADLLVGRERIIGRRTLKRLPFGWLIGRPNAFLEGVPAAP